eukprot:7431879-Pyramimonas_sp.AAC.1
MQNCEIRRLPNGGDGDGLASQDKKDSLCAPNLWDDGYLLRCNDCRHRIGTPMCFTCWKTAQRGARAVDTEQFQTKVVYKAFGLEK